MSNKIEQSNRGVVRVKHGRKFHSLEVKSECYEVAAVIEGSLSLPCSTHDECIAYVRQQMPAESETVISNVAWELYQIRKELK